MHFIAHKTAASLQSRISYNHLFLYGIIAILHTIPILYFVTVLH